MQSGQDAQSRARVAKAGDRLEIRTAAGVVYEGRVDAVTDSTITLEGRTFALEDLSTEAEQPIPGSNTLNTVLAMTATALVLGLALIYAAAYSAFN